MSDHRYAVIGAGPSGLSAARALQKAGIDFDGFEASRGVGGLWDIENPRSTMYESAHLISSRTTTEFAEFPMRTTADYPSHRELIAYFRDFADHFGLTEQFRFDTKVTSLERTEDGGWMLEATGPAGSGAGEPSSSATTGSSSPTARWPSRTSPPSAASSPANSCTPARTSRRRSSPASACSSSAPATPAATSRSTRCTTRHPST